jgi:hypothetical protein
MLFMIFDYGNQCYFRTRSRRGRYGNERFQSAIQGAGAAESHQVSGIFGNNDINPFGRIHDGTAADGDNGVTGVIPVKTSQLVDHL